MRTRPHTLSRSRREQHRCRASESRCRASEHRCRQGWGRRCSGQLQSAANKMAAAPRWGLPVMTEVLASGLVTSPAPATAAYPSCANQMAAVPRWGLPVKPRVLVSGLVTSPAPMIAKGSQPQEVQRQPEAERHCRCHIAMVH